MNEKEDIAMSDETVIVSPSMEGGPSEYEIMAKVQAALMDKLESLETRLMAQREITPMPRVEPIDNPVRCDAQNRDGHYCGRRLGHEGSCAYDPTATLVS